VWDLCPASPQIALVNWTRLADDFTVTPIARIRSSVPASTRDSDGRPDLPEYSIAIVFRPLSSALRCLSRSR
jgi:hypothetical protein